MRKTAIFLFMLIVLLSGCNLSTSPTDAAPAEVAQASPTTAPEATAPASQEPGPVEEPSPNQEPTAIPPTAEAEPTPGGKPEETGVSLDGVHLCSPDIPAPLPVGAGPAAPIQFAQGSYAAEWLVPPSTFNMPLQVLRTPDGQILVQSVRSSTLYQVTLEGETSVYTNLLSGYLGAVDPQGTVYMYSAPGGVIWRGTEGGWGEEFVRSPQLDTPCSSGFGLAPDGNLYVAYNSCADQSVLYMITQDGQVLPVNPGIPPMGALRSSPDGRFYGASYNRIYEISLMDFQATQLYELPVSEGVAESGLAFDDTGNIYLSTGTRDRSGQLWQISPFGDMQLIAEIPGNGLSGIAYIPETNEILGAQLIQGSLMAVNVQTGAKRVIVAGNGLVTPMAMAFSACGDLVVSNDDGGMMALVDPSGTVQRFFSYLSYTPPVPYLAVSADHTVYASECAPGLPNGITILPYGGDQPKELLRGLTPSGIAWLPDGSLVVAEALAGQVLKIDAAGNQSVLAEGLGFPQALAMGPGDEVYVTVGGSIISEALPAPFNAQSVLKILPDGATQTLADVAEGLFGLAVSPSGELYAATWQRVLKINPDGGYTEFASGFTGAVGLAFDLAGNLYVSDHVGNGIVRISGFPQQQMDVQVLNSSGEEYPNVQVQVFTSQPAVRGLQRAADESGRASFSVAPGVYTVAIIEDGVEISLATGIEVHEKESVWINMTVE